MWRPEIYKAWKQNAPAKKAHRALDDVRESIEELRFYRQAGFLP